MFSSNKILYYRSDTRHYDHIFFDGFTPRIPTENWVKNALQDFYDDSQDIDPALRTTPRK